MKHHAGRLFEGLGLGLVSALLFIACEPPDPTPDPDEAVEVPTSEGYIDAGDGIRLFHRTVGTGGDTVVVVHGGPALNMAYFGEDLAPLAEGNTVVFYDQRGVGRSTLVSDSLELDARRYVDDLEAVRRYLGLEALTLLGHSWGSGVAALYAMRHPERVRRLVIVSSTPLRKRQLTQTFEAFLAGLDPAVLSRLSRLREAWVADPGDAEICREYTTLFFAPFFADSAAASRSTGDFCAGPPEALRNQLNRVDRYAEVSLGDWDWRQALRDVTAPALIIHGTADPNPTQVGREWAEVLPNGRLLLIDGAGHFPYVEAPDRFFTAVQAFLRGEWPAGTRPAADPPPARKLDAGNPSPGT